MWFRLRRGWRYRRFEMGSEADVGRVPARLWVGCVELRIEGRRIRVGGAAALVCDVVAVDNPQEQATDGGDSVVSSIPSAAPYALSSSSLDWERDYQLPHRPEVF